MIELLVDQHVTSLFLLTWTVAKIYADEFEAGMAQ